MPPSIFRMTNNAIRNNRFLSRSHPKATTVQGSSPTPKDEIIPFDKELELASVQIIELVAKCKHREVHPLHIAFSLLFGNQDKSNSPLKEIPPSPILDIPLLWTMLVQTRQDPKVFGEKLRKELVKLRRNDDYDGVMEHNMRIPFHILKSASEHTKARLGRFFHALSMQSKTKYDEQGDNYLSIHHILEAILDDPTIKLLLETVENQRLLIEVLKRLRSSRVMSPFARPKYLWLTMFADDLTEMATVPNHQDQVLCRDDEIQRLMYILSRRHKRNAILLGDPGVGKTAIMEAFAQMIVSRKVSLDLNGRIFSLDLARLLAGTSCKGVYEKRVESLLTEIESNEDEGNKIFLFIDNFHLVVTGKRAGGEGGIDAANLFKPMLARGKLHCIGATTHEEYERCIRMDSSLERRFSIISIEEPSTSNSRTILRGSRDRYEKHHGPGVYIEDKALITAVNLAKQYNTRRRLPDSAFDIVDEACSRLYVANETCSDDIWMLEKQRKQYLVDMVSLKRENDPQSSLLLGEIEQKTEAIEREIQTQLEARSSQYNEIKALEDEIARLQNDSREMGQSLKFHAAREIQLEMVRKKDIYEIKKRELEKVNRIGKVQIEAELPLFLLHSENEERGRMLGKVWEVLNHTVVGQKKALEDLFRPIQITSVGLANPTLPLASSLLVGPSGCGKTLAVRTLSHSLFGSLDRLLTIDGSAYCDSFSITRLIGTPITCTPFDMAGELTEFVKRRPHSIILINQADQLCPEIKSMFAHILDRGLLNDGNGDTINFRNCFLFFTVNLPEEMDDNETRTTLHHIFSTVFISRIDNVVHFRKLSSTDLRNILSLRLQDLKILMNRRSINLSITPDDEDMLWATMQNWVVLARDIDGALHRGLMSSISAWLLHQSEHLSSQMKVTIKVGLDGNIMLNHATEVDQILDGAA